MKKTICIFSSLTIIGVVMTGFGLSALNSQIQSKPFRMERTLEGIKNINIDASSNYGALLEIVETTGSPKIKFEGDMYGLNFNYFKESDIFDITITGDTAFIDVKPNAYIQYGNFISDIIKTPSDMCNSKVILEIPKTGLDKLQGSAFAINININELNINILDLTSINEITFAGEGEIANLNLHSFKNNAGYIDFTNNIARNVNVSGKGYLHLDGAYKNVEISYGSYSEISVNSTEPYNTDINCGYESEVNVYGKVNIVDIQDAQEVLIMPSTTPTLINIDSDPSTVNIIFPEDIEGFEAVFTSYTPELNFNFVTTFDTSYNSVEDNIHSNLYVNKISYGNKKTKIDLSNIEDLKILRGE
ncbi:MAG: hypothetical protein ATN32_06820 [Candidatus Epulonipiscium fishelsonii]|nr:MAG: hypothetical protein ATN32_06820 [Epulopiscium sp. AS2M-Bin002]